MGETDRIGWNENGWKYNIYAKNIYIPWFCCCCCCIPCIPPIPHIPPIPNKDNIELKSKGGCCEGVVLVEVVEGVVVEVVDGVVLVVVGEVVLVEEPVVEEVVGGIIGLIDIDR